MENQHINESILSEEILEDQKKNRIDHMKYMPGMEDIGAEILDQVVDAMHAYACVVGCGGKDQFAVAESIGESQGHIVSCQIVYDNLRTAFAS